MYGRCARSILAAGALAASVLVGCSEDGASSETEEKPGVRSTSVRTAGALEPLPEDVPVDAAERELGRRLFFDPILSRERSVSCARCHRPAEGGDDGRQMPEGIGEGAGAIHTPTVLNAFLNVAQFWDGRAADLLEQAKEHVAGPAMEADWERVLFRLEQDEGYRERFRALYDDGITKNNVVRALAEYEKALLTPAPFDDYLRGDRDALGAEARKGYALFEELGCADCHRGPGVGGTGFRKIGVAHDYFADREGEITRADLGRYNITGRDEDRHELKVPLLRNVARTAPYFHDGSQAALEDAIRAMAHYQLGRELTSVQVRRLEAFLESLSGRLPPAAHPP